MSQRFEGIPESTKDAMTDAEVREVIARLSEERVAPKVGDVAAIAGASESDVRRVLEELRAEQALKASAEARRQVEVESTYVSPFMMGHRVRNGRQNVVIILTMALLAGLLMLMSIRGTTNAASAPLAPPPIETPALPDVGPPGTPPPPAPLPTPGG